MLKCSSERWVCGRQSLSAATATSPRLSVFSHDIFLHISHRTEHFRQRRCPFYRVFAGSHRTRCEQTAESGVHSIVVDLVVAVDWIEGACPSVERVNHGYFEL